MAWGDKDGAMDMGAMGLGFGVVELYNSTGKQICARTRRCLGHVLQL